ncbi:hypothetical protein BH23VER1_BH23VER1_06540 [soil metagenome]
MESGSRPVALDTIRNRILLALAVGGLLPLALVTVVNRTIITNELRASEFAKYREISRELQREVASVMKSASADLHSLTSSPIIVDAGRGVEERVNEMKRLVTIYEFTDISLYDADGIMVGTTTESHPEPKDQTRWLKSVASGESQKELAPPQIIGGHPGLHLSVYLPVRPAEGEESVEVLKARLPFDAIWEVLDGVNIGVDGRVVLLDSFGNILSSRDKEEILTKFDERYDEAFWRANESGIYQDSEGGQYAFVTRMLGEDLTRVGDRWTQITLVPKDELVAAIRKGDRYQYIAGAIALLLAGGVGALMSKKIAESATQAAVVAQQVARGNMGARIPEEGPLEMRRLAATFNLMVDEVSVHRGKLESLVALRTQKLQESQEKLADLTGQLRAAFESTKEAILMVRRDGTIVAANERTRKFFGLPDMNLSGMPFSRIEDRMFACFEDSEGFAQVWRESLAESDSSSRGDWRIVAPKGRELASYVAPVRTDRGESFALLWMFEDVTKERELQAGLEQAQKMEAIGRLAGGVAHDFNNLLTGIIGNLSLAQMEVEHAGRGAESDRYIANAKQAGERAADLVKQLLGFSRRSHLTLGHCDVNAIIGEVYELLRHTIDPRVQIEVSADPEVWGVKADATHVQQVIMNMCVNAKDAMPEGGAIRLTSENVEVGKETGARLDDKAGSYVRVVVEDDGEGMSDEVRGKIFEPFFTTKDQGKGTGLGLATCYGIVQQHDGWIDCESVLGEGTRFSIYFPRDEGQKRRVAAAVRPEEKKIEGGHETVLLVDDEVVVRAVAESVLKHHGYKTLTASDGIEGVEAVRAFGGEISLVLLDLTMPRLSGKDTFRMIREIYPDLPVVICSGYLLNLEQFARETGHVPSGFVQKPYQVGSLAEVVRQVIDGRQGVVATPEGNY